MLLPALVLAQDLDWPTFRHDEGRTGRSSGAGVITSPAVKWRYDLGGSLGVTQVWFGDANGDGMPDVAMAAGGKLVLKDTQDRFLWQSEVLGVGYIVGAWDLDGDGDLEIVASRAEAPAGLAIVSGQTGELLWYMGSYDPVAGALPDYQVLVADLDGDSVLEVLTKPDGYLVTHCFSFGDGFSPDPADNQEWEYTHERYANSNPYMVGDVDNDGSLEAVTFENRRITILNGEDGTLQAAYDDVFYTHSFGLMLLANVDADPQNEIVAIGLYYYNYAVTVFDAVDGAVSWQYQWYPTDGKGIVASEQSLSDLDGDGSLELVVGLYNDIDDEHTTYGSVVGEYDGINLPDQWVLAVFDAATGVLKASLPDAYLRGVVDLDGDGNPEILAQPVPPGFPTVDEFGTLQALELSGSELLPRWSISDTDVSVAFMRANTTLEGNMRGMGYGVAAQDLDADGMNELYLRVDTDQDGREDLLRTYHADLATPAVAAELAMPQHLRPFVVALGSGLSGPGVAGQTAVFITDGRLDILAPDFSTMASLRTGGHATSPLVADLDGDGAMEIIVSRSSNVVEVLTTAGTGPLEPPLPIWSYMPHVSQLHMTADLDGDGSREVLIRDNADRQNPKMVLLNADGSVRWTHTLDNFGSAPNNAAFGYFDGDNVLDVVLTAPDQTLPDAEDMRIIALNGLSGEEIWNVPSARNYSVRYPLHVDEVNGDGYSDIILLDTNRIEYYSGLDGTLLLSVPETYYANWNILADFDGDGVRELLVNNHSIEKGLQLFELLDPVPVWSLPHANAGEIQNWLGAFGASLGLGFVRQTSYGTLQAFGPDALPVWAQPRYPRRGEMLESDPGSSVNLSGVSVCDIDGDSGEEAIFGTEDGYLMAARVSDGSLLWAVELPHKVAEPVLADLDGDGQLEILVAAYDGYLRLIDQAGLDQPAEVRDVALDIDLQLVGPYVDADETEVLTALGASWEPVAGASGYRVSASFADFVVVPWSDVGDVDQAVLTSAPLVLGHTYRVSVQAYNQQGDISAAASSDGVQVLDLTPPGINDLRVFPATFNPDVGHTTVSAGLVDLTGITGYEVAILQADDTVIRTYPANASSTRVNLSQQWDGRIGSPGGPLAAAGTYTVRVRVADLGDHQTEETTTVTVDFQIPMPPVITQPEEGGLTNQNQPQLAGTAEPEMSVQVYIDGAPACVSATTDEGDWQCTSGRQLADGMHAATADASNSAGSTSEPSLPVEFTIDTTRPDPPVIEVPVEGAVVTLAQPAVSGTAEAGSQVTVREPDPGRDLCSGRADAQGVFWCKSTVELEDGAHRIVAQAVDPAGNLSEPSGEVSFAVNLSSADGGDPVDVDVTGCGCLSRHQPASSLTMLLLLLALALRRVYPSR